MGLPWVRLEANIASHDKILLLLADPSPKKWQAAASYMFALAWSGGHGTDGFIPQVAVSDVRGTNVTARLLLKYKLWDEGLAGWWIHNYEVRQQTSEAAESKRKAQSVGGKKSACVKNHPVGCQCWKDAA